MKVKTRDIVASLGISILLASSYGIMRYDHRAAQAYPSVTRVETIEQIVGKKMSIREILRQEDHILTYQQLIAESDSLQQLATYKNQKNEKRKGRAPFVPLAFMGGLIALYGLDKMKPATPPQNKSSTYESRDLSF